MQKFSGLALNQYEILRSFRIHARAQIYYIIYTIIIYDVLDTYTYIYLYVHIGTVRCLNFETDCCTRQFPRRRGYFWRRGYRLIYPTIINLLNVADLFVSRGVEN